MHNVLNGGLGHSQLLPAVHHMLPQHWGTAGSLLKSMLLIDQAVMAAVVASGHRLWHRAASTGSVFHCDASGPAMLTARSQGLQGPKLAPL